jgi:YVTN family beta-propeller protein
MSTFAATRRPGGRLRRVLVALTSTAAVTTAGLAVPATPAVAVAAGGTTAYVTDFNANTVSVVDTATNTVTATVPTGTRR